MRKQYVFGLMAVDVIVVLSGVIMLLVMGYISISPVNALLEAIGTSLIGAGFVTYLLRRFAPEQQQSVALRIVSDSRVVLDNEYKQRKYSAHVIDILSIALSGALRELATDPQQTMLKRILSNRAKVRLAFLSPTATYVSHRSIEDGTDVLEVEETLKKSMLYCFEIYKRLHKLHENARKNGTLERDRMGALEIRLIDMCPHFTTFRTDDVILWGIYTSANRGLHSPVIEVSKDQPVLYEQLVGHFEKLWVTNTSNLREGNYLVRYYDPNPPVLNESLFVDILGPDWKVRYQVGK